MSNKQRNQWKDLPVDKVEQFGNKIYRIELDYNPKYKIPI